MHRASQQFRSLATTRSNHTSKARQSPWGNQIRRKKLRLEPKSSQIRMLGPRNITATLAQQSVKTSQPRKSLRRLNNLHKPALDVPCVSGFRSPATGSSPQRLQLYLRICYETFSCNLPSVCGLLHHWKTDSRDYLPDTTDHRARLDSGCLMGCLFPEPVQDR
jgi:hypothetical protein